MLFPDALAWSESQTATKRILIRVTDSISYDNTRYAKFVNLNPNVWLTTAICVVVPAVGFPMTCITEGQEVIKLQVFIGGINTN